VWAISIGIYDRNLICRETTILLLQHGIETRRPHQTNGRMITKQQMTVATRKRLQIWNNSRWRCAARACVCVTRRCVCVRVLALVCVFVCAWVVCVLCISLHIVSGAALSERVVYERVAAHARSERKGTSRRGDNKSHPNVSRRSPLFFFLSILVFTLYVHWPLHCYN